jgi:Fe-S cluster biogenesis protein NfuA
LASIGHAQASFTGAGQQAALDCDGGAAEVQGADNQLTITGACSALHIQGASNRITVQLALKSSIIVEGADNIVTWTAPAAARPRIAISGAANRVHRKP